LYTPCFGDMWDRWGTPVSLFCITANSYLRRDGALTMGRGIAKQLKDMQPEIAWDAAAAIRDQPIPHAYGFVVIPVIQSANRVRSEIKQMVGFFQVKDHFKSLADLKLIAHSVQALKAYLHDHRHIPEVNLNYPGIGYGCRTVTDVEPLLRSLPPVVHIWRFAHER